MPEAIRLEPLSDRHAAAIAALIQDPDTLRFTRVPDPPPPGYERSWVERYETGRRDGSREGFAAVDGDGSFLGLALAPRIDRETRELELGYVVAREARGRGVATEILRRLTRWAFDEVGAERIELLIAVDNPASKRVAARCGYVLEGVLRSAYFKQGIRSDTEVWSRLPSDPEP